MADEPDMPTAEFLGRAGAVERRLRHLVAGTAVAASAVALRAAVQAWDAPPDLPVLLASALGIALATAVPCLAQQDVTDDSAHTHAAVLVPALFLFAWHGAVIAVVAGVAGGWLLRRLPGLRGAPPANHNREVVGSLSRATLAAAVAGVVAAWPVEGGTTPILLAVAGATVFLGVQHGLAAATASVAGVPRDARAPHRGRRTWAVSVVGLALGLLTTLVVAAYPAPAAWVALQAVLVTVVALALSSLDTARAHHGALLRIAAHAHASMDLTTVERAVDENLAPLLRAVRVEIRDLPPGHDDVGTPLPLHAGDPAWLVATHRGRATHGFSDRDRRLLASAAPLVATAVENARQHGDMAVRASTDPLTGVANRRTFEERLSLRLRHSRITDGATALVVLDMDAFKAINDELGHAAGDELLVEVARRLTAGLRAGDLVARLGGDEFAVVAALASADEEEILIERVAGGLSGLQASDGRPVGISFGVAVAPRDGHSTRPLYDAADQRMYAVKHGAAV